MHVKFECDPITRSLLQNNWKGIRSAFQSLIYDQEKLNIHFADVYGDPYSSQVVVKISISNTWEMKYKLYNLESRVVEALRNQSWSSIYQKTMEKLMKQIDEGSIVVNYSGDIVTE